MVTNSVPKLGLSQLRLNSLRTRYGSHSSWAIWDSEDLSNTQVIAEHFNCLTGSVVLVGLNISRLIGAPWQNFHSRRRDHARKLVLAFNESPYRGAYMTDVIKDEVAPKSGDLISRIRSGKVDVTKHMIYFQTEMSHLGANAQSLFVLFGKSVSMLFEKHLAKVFSNYVMCPHYSKYGQGFTDAEWVDKVWTILEAHTAESGISPRFFRNNEMKTRLKCLQQSRRMTD